MAPFSRMRQLYVQLPQSFGQFAALTAVHTLFRTFQTFIKRDTCRFQAYRCADKSLARPRRKQARKHVRDASDFNNIETRAVIKFFSLLQGKAPKEIDAILTETLACFLPGLSKDLTAPMYKSIRTSNVCIICW